MTVTSKVLSPLTIVKTTGVSGSPFKALEASVASQSSTASPSMWLTKSPERSPALSAGEPGKTLLMLTI